MNIRLIRPSYKCTCENCENNTSNNEPLFFSIRSRCFGCQVLGFWVSGWQYMELFFQNQHIEQTTSYLVGIKRKWLQVALILLTHLLDNHWQETSACGYIFENIFLYYYRNLQKKVMLELKQNMIICSPLHPTTTQLTATSVSVTLVHLPLHPALHNIAGQYPNKSNNCKLSYFPLKP